MLCDVITGDYMDPKAPSDPSHPRLWDFKVRNKELEMEFDDLDEDMKYDSGKSRCTVFGEVGLYLKKA